MKKFLSLVALTVFIGCSTTTAYKTIATTEAAVSSANSAYLDSVVTGQTRTNDVPRVEQAFNSTQMALHAAAAIASGGSGASTPPAVAAQASDFQNLVNSVKGVK